MSTYNHPLSYFQSVLFFLGEDKKSVGETTLEAFLREWHEGDPARAWYVKTTNEGFEVREGKHSNILRDRLVDTFETEEEANRFHLNGLYWNYCDSNRDSGAPYTSDKREDVEEEIKTLAAMDAEETAGA